MSAEPSIALEASYLRVLEEPITFPTRSDLAEQKRFRATRRRILKHLKARFTWDKEENASAIATDQGLRMNSERFHAYFFPERRGCPGNLGRVRRLRFLKSFKRDPLPTLLHFGFSHPESHTERGGSRQSQVKGAQS